MGSQLLDILLRREGLGLKAAIVHEEAGCAALGAGVGSACVVDIGSQRASVCCIDEGMPMPGCRQILSYGATDMDALLHTLLHRHRLTTALPPALAAPPSYKPTETALHALRELRHRGCSLRLELDPQEAPSVDLPGSPPLLASAVLGSLGAIPPLLLFTPAVAWALQRALGVPRPLGSLSAFTKHDHSDVWDDEFLNETALDRALPAGVTPAQPKETFVGVANFAPSLTPLGQRHSRGLTPEAQLGYTPLDEAVVRAVERGKSTEVKRRLYGTILLVGGGAHVPGLAQYLEWRVACCWKLAEDSTEGIERIEVTKLPLGTEPESLVWHGAATLPELESGPALWILKSEWEQRGALAAREACAFSW